MAKYTKTAINPEVAAVFDSYPLNKKLKASARWEMVKSLT
jgi:hypothetical protein